MDDNTIWNSTVFRFPWPFFVTPQTDELVTEALILALYLKHESVMAGSVYAYILGPVIYEGKMRRVLYMSHFLKYHLCEHRMEIISSFFFFHFYRFFQRTESFFHCSRLWEQTIVLQRSNGLPHSLKNCSCR